MNFTEEIKLFLKNNSEEKNIPIINNIDSIKHYTDTYNREKNTILINLLGRSGCILRYDFRIFLNHYFYSIHSKDKSILNENYLYHYLTSIQDKIYNIRNSSLATYISLYEIANITIHIPSLEGQLKILNKIKENNDEIEKLYNSIEEIKLKNKKIILNN